MSLEIFWKWMFQLIWQSAALLSAAIFLKPIRFNQNMSTSIRLIIQRSVIKATAHTSSKVSIISGKFFKQKKTAKLSPAVFNNKTNI